MLHLNDAGSVADFRSPIQPEMLSARMSLAISSAMVDGSRTA